MGRALILAARHGTRLSPGHTSGAGQDRRPPGYYFIACDEHPTYASSGWMIAAALGRRRVLIAQTPPRSVWCVAVANELFGRIRRRPLYLNFDKAREIRAGSWLCSTEAAKQDLGFTVTVPLADRLSQTAQWYRREGWI